ncbi:tetratricopeptide repeat protein [Amycolatopsis sp. NPDC003865]
MWEAHALNAAAWQAARLGDHHTARSHCAAALSLQRRHHNPTGQANALRTLGDISRLTGHENEAVEQFHALTLYREHGATVAEAEVASRLSHARRTPTTPTRCGRS